MNEPKGAIFFWKDEPFITGYLTIGKDQYELVGVRRSDIRTDFTGRKKQLPEQQAEMFDERSGDSNPERDQS
jgi:hypothetical protein